MWKVCYQCNFPPLLGRHFEKGTLGQNEFFFQKILIFFSPNLKKLNHIFTLSKPFWQWVLLELGPLYPSLYSNEAQCQGLSPSFNPSKKRKLISYVHAKTLSTFFFCHSPKNISTTHCILCANNIFLNLVMTTIDLLPQCHCNLGNHAIDIVESPIVPCILVHNVELDIPFYL